MAGVPFMKKYGMLGFILALFFLILLFMAPKPSATGSCDISCSLREVDVPYGGSNEIDLSGVCPSDCDCCEVYLVTEHVTTDGWLVKYECCNCIGDADLALPSCNSHPLGFIYSIFGMCE